MIALECHFHHCALYLSLTIILVWFNSVVVQFFIVCEWNLLSYLYYCLIFHVSAQEIPSISYIRCHLQVILYLCSLQLVWNAWCWHFNLYYYYYYFLCHFFLHSAGAVPESYIWMWKTDRRVPQIVLLMLHIILTLIFVVWNLYACDFAKY